MDGDGSYGNTYSPMAAEEPHADPELPQPPSPTTEATTFAAEFLATLAHLAASVPAGPYVAPVTFDLNRLADAWHDEGDQVDGDGDIDAGVGEDDAYANGGFGAVPASEEAMAALPEKTVGEGEATEEEECAVCLEGYEAGDALRTMPCAHAFHEHCIFGWLSVSRLCPLCRFALPAEVVNSDTEDEHGDDDDDEDDDDVELI